MAARHAHLALVSQRIVPVTPRPTGIETGKGGRLMMGVDGGTEVEDGTVVVNIAVVVVSRATVDVTDEDV